MQSPTGDRLHHHRERPASHRLPHPDRERRHLVRRASRPPPGYPPRCCRSGSCSTSPTAPAPTAPAGWPSRRSASAAGSVARSSGWLADHAGQRVVALGATPGAGPRPHRPAGARRLRRPGLVLVAAAVVGLANPQAGAMARSRWASIAKGRRDRRSYTATAMAWEGAVDETSFVVGPVLVGTVAGRGLADRGPGARPRPRGHHPVRVRRAPSALPGRTRTDRVRDEQRAPLPLARFACLLLAMGAIGVVFGATQTGVAARMAENGTAGLTGPVYAAMGVGSAAAGLLTTRLPARFTLPTGSRPAGALLVLGGLLTATRPAPGPARRRLPAAGDRARAGAGQLLRPGRAPGAAGLGDHHDDGARHLQRGRRRRRRGRGRRARRPGLPRRRAAGELRGRRARAGGRVCWPASCGTPSPTAPRHVRQGPGSEDPRPCR